MSAHDHDREPDLERGPILDEIGPSAEAGAPVTDVKPDALVVAVAPSSVAPVVSLKYFDVFDLVREVRGLIGFGVVLVDDCEIEPLLAIRRRDGRLLVTPILTFEVPGAVRLVLPPVQGALRIDDPRLTAEARHEVIRLLVDAATKSERAS